MLREIHGILLAEVGLEDYPIRTRSGVRDDFRDLVRVHPGERRQQRHQIGDRLLRYQCPVDHGRPHGLRTGQLTTRTIHYLAAGRRGGHEFDLRVLSFPNVLFARDDLDLPKHDRQGGEHEGKDDADGSEPPSGLHVDHLTRRLSPMRRVMRGKARAAITRL